MARSGLATTPPPSPAAIGPLPIASRQGGTGARLTRLLRHPDQSRPKQPVLDHVAGLKLLDDRAGLGLVRRDLEHRLVAVGIERLAERFDAGDAVALEHGVELAARHLDA